MASRFRLDERLEELATFYMCTAMQEHAQHRVEPAMTKNIDAEHRHALFAARGWVCPWTYDI